LIPSALHFSRFRAFLEPARIELAPLTIVIGKNGSGKSVLTRLPLLISGGLWPTSDSVLDLSAGGISHASRYDDLIYQRSSQPFSIGAEISDGPNNLQFVTTMRYVLEIHAPGIEEFELRRDGNRVLRLRLTQPEQLAARTATFAAQRGEDETEALVQVSFSGLFPTTIDGDAQIAADVSSARAMFEASFKAPSYLGPFRSEQGALLQVPRQGIRDLGPRGERALDIIADDWLRGDGQLLAAVGDWFEASMNARLKLEGLNGLARILVHDSARDLDVDLSETGAGFAQVFPVVVQALARKRGNLNAKVVIVEQPELHLHPGAHGEIADLICSTVSACGTDVRYICETHSEQFITRVRRRIAEGTFPASSVRIVSVGHQAAVEDPVEPVRMIAIDESGAPDSWPIGVFDEAFNDLVEMRKAAQDRADDGL
jgi:predicted ATPase